MAAAAGKTENLAEMENLTEETLLNELRVRFRANIIYTYVGEILVTVNPFKWIGGLYEPDKMKFYANIGDKKNKPPHIYALADIAYTNMVSTNENQVCVISGESGAGKTEAAKLFVKQIVTVSNGVEYEGLEQKLIQVNPLLEAFGNAKTGMNDNSSRFGKFTDLRFTKEGSIKGAVMREYLLEKSRVVYQSDNEQNFHVFYLFFAGLTEADRDLYEVSTPDRHRYLMGNSNALAKIKSKEMTEMYKELMECTKIVGFSETQTENLFHILSGILHMGDLEFDGEDGARIVSEGNLLTTICNQLGIDENALEMALTKQVMVIRGEETEIAYKLHEAEDCRDASAKALYGRAFSWIIEQCNQLLGPRQSSPGVGDISMGILDIFGFECFDSNSFEQLCINLTNEQLQFFFNNHIFAMELAEYAKEGITGKNITYQDNQPLLDLLLTSKNGLLMILNEESNFPKATDSSMIGKFHAAFDKHKDYTRPRGNEDIFSLKHYAGQVTYEGLGFLEKNRDTLAVDVIGAFRLSENSLVKTLFGGNEDSEKAAGGSSGAAGRKKPAARKKLDRQASRGRMRQSIKFARESIAKKKPKTVAQSFKDSLADLMRDLNAALPHFVRCVKPNTRKTPDTFEDDLVTKQLRYTGMLETTRIRREGYASRPVFGDFIKRYKVLGFEARAKLEPSGDACRRILEKAGITGFEIGKTKVFMRYWHVDELNEKLVPYTAASSIIGRVCRGFAQRHKFEKLLTAKRDQDRRIDQFVNQIERAVQGVRDVVLSLCEEDGRRPRDYWSKPAPVEAPKASVAGAAKQSKITRAASVKWFKEVEKKKGAGQDGSGFANWFHGIISRKESEDILAKKPTGTFLIRVAESRFGYSLSLMFNGRCKHFMIDQNDAGQYVVVGNERTFPSLNEVVAFHSRHQVTDDGDVLLHPCAGEGARDDLRELE